jgi:hypothetical protein
MTLRVMETGICACASGNSNSQDLACQPLQSESARSFVSESGSTDNYLDSPTMFSRDSMSHALRYRIVPRAGLESGPMLNQARFNTENFGVYSCPRSVGGHETSVHVAAGRHTRTVQMSGASPSADRAHHRDRSPLTGPCTRRMAKSGRRRRSSSPAPSQQGTSAYTGKLVTILCYG